MVKAKFLPSPLPRILGEQADPVIEIKPIVRYHRYETAWRLLQIAIFVMSLLWMKWVRRRSKAHVAMRVRNFLERMGGLFIKAGQVLSLRSDFLTPEMVDELSKLQSRAYGFAPRVARRIIEETIGKPIEDVFDNYEDMPFAAASISQEHRARLRRNGLRLVLKVQRPNMSEIFQRDLAMITWVVHSLATFWTFVRRLKPEAFLVELRQILHEELDFRYEIGNLLEMRKRLRKHGVFIPKVFREYSGQRLIVMEELAGTLMSDYLAMERIDPAGMRAWCAANQIKPRRVGSRLLRSFYRQIFEENLFHGDLHPGNIMLFRKSRIGLLDLGSVGSLDKSFVRTYKSMLSAVAEHEYVKAIDYYLQLSDSVPLIDVAALRAELIHVFRTWEARSRVPGLTYLEKSASGAIVNEMQKVEEKYGMIQSWQLLRVGRATITLDSNLSILLADADPAKIIRKYFRQAQARASKGLRRGLGFSAASAAGQIREIMSSAAGVFRKASIEFQGVSGLGAHLSSVIATGVYWITWIAAGFALVFLISPTRVTDFVESHPVLDRIAPLVSGLGAIGRAAGAVMLVSALVLVRAMNSVRGRIMATNVRLPSGNLAK
jgi:ubiquinone biosynthesis protein